MRAYFRRQKWEHTQQARAVIRAYIEAVERGKTKQRTVTPNKAIDLLGGMFEGT